MVYIHIILNERKKINIIMQNFQKLIKLPQLFLFLLGNAFVAYSYQGFVSANDFLSGGTYGMAGIVTYFLDFLPFSLVVLLDRKSVV